MAVRSGCQGNQRLLTFQHGGAQIPAQSLFIFFNRIEKVLSISSTK
jgi:hypothetical protein